MRVKDVALQTVDVLNKKGGHELLVKLLDTLNTLGIQAEMGKRLRRMIYAGATEPHVRLLRCSHCSA